MAAVEGEGQRKRREVDRVVGLAGEPPKRTPECRTLHKIFLEPRHRNSNKTPSGSSSVTQMYSKPDGRAMRDAAMKMSEDRGAN